MKICTTCVLPETFPGIHFDEEGVCNYCRNGKAERNRYKNEKERYGAKFRSLLDQHKKERQGPYDVITAYSGGKDSTYTLKILTQTHGLRALAVIFDHGFISPQAMENIHIATDALGVDRIMISPSRGVLYNAFRRSVQENPYSMKSLIRASAMCNTCMHLVKSSILKLAVEMGIPFIAYGWSPGQAPVQSSVLRLNPSMIRHMQGAAADLLKKIMGDEFERFVLSARDYQMLSLTGPPWGGGFLYAVHPLAHMDYNEERIIHEIEMLGWKPPLDTDPNSTNCLLNIFSGQLHLDQYGFHPYAHEIAGLVREGYMTREAGLAKVSAPFDIRTFNKVGKQLGMLETLREVSP